MKPGVTATDLVLTVTQMLRKMGVVGKFVEFYGPGLNALSLADRATIANMAPEYGATCGFFPVDEETIAYLTMTARANPRIALVEAYAKAQGLYRTKASPDPVFTETLDLDLDSVMPSMAGPKRPEGRVALGAVAEGFRAALESDYKKSADADTRYLVDDKNYDLGHGDVVIAAITSCTNTSKPNVLIGAGLLARNALAKGLSTKPWVKTSLAPGSQVVAEYLSSSGLQKDLDKLGFNLSASAARPASAIRDPCRRRFQRRSTNMASSPPPCFRAIAISKAASAPTCRRIISLRRRLSSPTPLPER